ncbi:hypothetical protein BDZ45DRAFT_804053 [Acephala macrosclerotiorum]|nr:hypothetical protein BDZ45DRAFT_804053 [Acephala macrosclerotiorum]
MENIPEPQLHSSIHEVGGPKQDGRTPGLSQQEAGIVAGDFIVARSGSHLPSLHQSIQTPKVDQQIRSAFKSEEEITLTSTNSLKYQNSAISEGLRLFPAGPETTRRVTNKDENMICGDLIPANFMIDESRSLPLGTRPPLRIIFDIELCKESDDWLKMDAHTLVYKKRPLMARLKSVRG